MSGKNEKKLTRLNERIIEIDNMIKNLTAERKGILKQIDDLNQLEKFDYIKSQKLSLEQLTTDLEIGKLLRENGISKDEVTELLLGSIKKKEDTTNEND